MRSVLFLLVLALGSCATGSAPDSDCEDNEWLCDGRCVQDCPAGWQRNTETCLCDELGCPDGQEQCRDNCLPECPFGQRHNALTCICEDMCPDGFVWNGASCEPEGGDSDTDTDTDTDSDTGTGTGTEPEDLYDPDNMCIRFGEDGEPFCGVDCEGNPGICPDGFDCFEVGDGYGGVVAEMCAPTDNDCAGERAPDPLCDPCDTDEVCQRP